MKTLLQRKLAGNQAASVVLEEHAKDPDTFAAPLIKKLAEAAVDRDGDIMAAARALLEQTRALPAAGLVITQTISNVKYAATYGSGDASIGVIHEQPPWPWLSRGRESGRRSRRRKTRPPRPRATPCSRTPT